MAPYRSPSLVVECANTSGDTSDAPDVRANAFRRPNRCVSPSPYGVPMNPELLDRLRPFRAEALARGIPDAVFHAVKAAELDRWDGPVSADVSDWVLLADWQAGMDIQGWESATVHWVIQREDLAARRFDRAYTGVFWNP